LKYRNMREDDSEEGLERRMGRKGVREEGREGGP
jgi:hypothetical protein